MEILLRRLLEDIEASMKDLQEMKERILKRLEETK